MPHSPENVLQSGVEGITDSLGSLVHTSFRLAETTAEVMERELALVVRLSQRVRDEVISADLLAKARKQPIPARFRDDAHALVDVAADFGAVLFQSSVNFIDALTGTKSPSHPVLPA